MSDKDSAQNVIDSYRKRQSMAQKAPLIFAIAAILLIIGAAIIIWVIAGGGVKCPCARYSDSNDNIYHN